MSYNMFARLWTACAPCPGCLPPQTPPQSYTLEKAAPCLVATWPALAQGQTGQEHLFLTEPGTGDSTVFKLGVMIVNRRNKFVCMFRYVCVMHMFVAVCCLRQGLAAANYIHMAAERRDRRLPAVCAVAVSAPIPPGRRARLVESRISDPPGLPVGETFSAALLSLRTDRTLLRVYAQAWGTGFGCNMSQPRQTSTSGWLR